MANLSPKELLALAMQQSQATAAKLALLAEQEKARSQAGQNLLSNAASRSSAGTQLTFPEAEFPGKPKTLAEEIAALNNGRLPNKEQLEAIERGLNQEGFCLMGAAGTGKTTTIKMLATLMMTRNTLPKFEIGTRVFAAKTPAVAFVSFTNRAVNNLRRQLPIDLQGNCCTIHRALEYIWEPETITDPTTGETKTIMSSHPRRTAANPIDELQYVFLEESSNCGLRLHDELKAACPNATFVYLGDIFQLNPPYDLPILAFKLDELPVVELVEIWRQAADNPVIQLAHQIKNGQLLTAADLKRYSADPRIKFKPHPTTDKGTQYNVGVIQMKMQHFVQNKLIHEFNPLTDMVLCPQNVGFGCEEINRWFAQKYAELRDVPVWEVIAGREHHYLAIGDKLMVNKQECVIWDIEENPSYIGQVPRKASKTLTRWGIQIGGAAEHFKEELDEDAEKTDDEIDWTIPDMNLELTRDEINERKHAASHIIKVLPLAFVENQGVDKFLDVRTIPLEVARDWLQEIKTAKELNDSSFAYCITVHKAQGSEWKNVHGILHNRHGVMLTRELLYTLVTRTSENLTLYFNNDSTSLTHDGSLNKCIKNPQLGGITLQDKIKNFTKKVKDRQTLIQLKNAGPGEAEKRLNNLVQDIASSAGRSNRGKQAILDILSPEGN